MGQVSSSLDSSGRCPRCHVGLRPGARRCQACGEVFKGGRRVTLYVGIVGIVLMLMVVVVGLLLTPNSVDEPQGDDDQQDQPAQPSPLPKEPPLNR